MIKGVKICGVSDHKTLNYIVEHPYPPQFIGFITNYEKSIRFVEFEKLKKLIIIKKKGINFVSVLVNPNDEILEKIKNLNFDYYQLYDVNPEKTKTIKGSVTLPIVTGIGDQNQVDWQGASLNPLQSLGAAGALGIFESVRQGSGIAEAISGAGGAMQEGISRIRDNKTVGNDIQSAINVYLAQRAVGAQGASATDVW